MTLINRNNKTTYIESILKTDQDYKDKVFWLVENSSGETAESIRKFTLGWATEYQKRLEKRLHDKAKRNSRGGKEGE